MTNDDFFINQDGSGVTTNRGAEKSSDNIVTEELGSGLLPRSPMVTLAGAAGHSSSRLPVQQY